jgi:hypothetical protein
MKILSEEELNFIKLVKSIFVREYAVYIITGCFGEQYANYCD